MNDIKDDDKISPNDPEVSDGGGWQASCTAGGQTEAEAASMTAGAVRCTDWLGDVRSIKEYKSLNSLSIVGQKPEFVAQSQELLKKASDYHEKMHGKLESTWG